MATPTLETGQPTVPVVTPPSPASAQDSADSVLGAGAAAAASSDAGDSGDKEGKKKKNRCQSCKKKVGLTGFTCRCGGLFCSIHRYSDKHDCSFDYKVTTTFVNKFVNVFNVYGLASSLFLILLKMGPKSTKIGLDTRHPWVYYFYLSKFTRIMT